MSGAGRSARARGRVTRLMLDTNIFDELVADAEAAAELENRRDLRPVISDVQLQQLQAIPDPERRALRLELAGRLCGTVRAPLAGQPQSSEALGRTEADRHQPDRMIAAATLARCDMLVTNDKGLLDYARRTAIVAMDWRSFLHGILYRAG